MTTDLEDFSVNMKLENLKLVPNQYNVIVFDKYPEHIHNIQFKSILKTYTGDFSDSVLVDEILKNHLKKYF